MLNYEPAEPLNILSLQNWVKTTGCLARDETEYLNAKDDLLCVAAHSDTFLVRLELLLERAIVFGWSSFGQVCISALATSLRQTSEIQCNLTGCYRLAFPRPCIP